MKQASGIKYQVSVNASRAMLLGLFVFGVAIGIASAQARVPVRVLGPDDPVRISSAVARKNLIKEVRPVTPGDAVLRTTQTVRLAVLIGKDGRVQNIHLLEGPPLLIGAAFEAVKKYEYKPYLLNDQPHKVEAVIEVKFPPTRKKK